MVISRGNLAPSQNYPTYGNILHIYPRLPLSHKITAPKKASESEKSKEHSHWRFSSLKKAKTPLPSNVRFTCNNVYRSIKLHITWVRICSHKAQISHIYLLTLFSIQNLLNPLNPSKSKLRPYKAVSIIRKTIKQTGEKKNRCCNAPSLLPSSAEERDREPHGLISSKSTTKCFIFWATQVQYNKAYAGLFNTTPIVNSRDSQHALLCSSLSQPHLQNPNPTNPKTVFLFILFPCRKHYPLTHVADLNFFFPLHAPATSGKRGRWRAKETKSLPSSLFLFLHVNNTT